MHHPASAYTRSFCEAPDSTEQRVQSVPLSLAQCRRRRHRKHAFESQTCSSFFDPFLSEDKRPHTSSHRRAYNHYDPGREYPSSCPGVLHGKKGESNYTVHRQRIKFNRVSLVPWISGAAQCPENTCSPKCALPAFNQAYRNCLAAIIRKNKKSAKPE